MLQQNLIITFWPIYSVHWYLHANSFSGTVGPFIKPTSVPDDFGLIKRVGL